MGNIFDLRPVYYGDTTTPRCRHEFGPCSNASQFDDHLCGFHHAQTLHQTEHLPGQLGEASASSAGCWFCPAAPGQVSRLAEQRLQQLAELEDGWYDGHGLAPTAAALAGARTLLLAAPAAVAAEVSLGPSDEGAVSVEDHRDDRSWLLADVEPDGSYALFSPLTDRDEKDPTHEDGLRFTAAEELWTYVTDVWSASRRTEEVAGAATAAP